jgi:hypothetical protein
MLARYVLSHAHLLLGIAGAPALLAPAQHPVPTHCRGASADGGGQTQGSGRRCCRDPSDHAGRALPPAIPVVQPTTTPRICLSKQHPAQRPISSRSSSSACSKLPAVRRRQRPSRVWPGIKTEGSRYCPPSPVNHMLFPPQQQHLRTPPLWWLVCSASSFSRPQATGVVMPSPPARRASCLNVSCKAA